MVCFSLVPRPRPAFRRLQYVVSRIAIPYCKRRKAGGGGGAENEVFAWRCQLAPLLGGRPRKATKHSFVPTTTPTGKCLRATAVFILCRYNSDVSSKRSLIHTRLAAKQCKLWCTATHCTPVAWDSVGTSLICRLSLPARVWPHETS